MKSIVKAGEEQMINEALLRMERLGLSEECRNRISKENRFPVFLAPDGKLSDVEEEADLQVWENGDLYHGYGWALLKEEYQDLHGDGVSSGYEFHLLFVSENPEDWERERAELATMEPTMFHYRIDRALYPDQTEEALVKKKIRITACGGLALE